MPKKKQKRKPWHKIPKSDCPTARDLWRESQEMNKNQDEYFG